MRQSLSCIAIQSNTQSYISRNKHCRLHFRMGHFECSGYEKNLKGHNNQMNKGFYCGSMVARTNVFFGCIRKEGTRWRNEVALPLCVAL